MAARPAADARGLRPTRPRIAPEELWSGTEYVALEGSLSVVPVGEMRGGHGG